MKKKIMISLLFLSSATAVQAGLWEGVKNFFEETGTFIKNTVKGAGKVVAAPFRSSREEDKTEQKQHEVDQKVDDKK